MEKKEVKPASVHSKSLVKCSITEFYSTLKSGHEGLSTDEANLRHGTSGPNAFPENDKIPLVKKIISELANIFNILLLTAALISFVIGKMTSDSGSYQMGYAILGAIVVNLLFSIIQEYRAEKAIKAISKLVPQNSKVMRDGKTIVLPISKLVVGDLIVLEEGDKIPADSRIISGYSVSVDDSVLTGESTPRERSPHVNPLKVNLTEEQNILLAGTTMISGSATAMVFATGKDTEFGKVMQIANSVVEPISPLEKKINRMARQNLIMSFFIGIIFLGLSYFFLHLDIFTSLLFMIGVMISIVPEGLQMTVTLSLAFSSMRMVKRNVVVKRLSAVETLGSTTVICTDKTGTITEGQMTARHMWISNKIYNISGEGYKPEGMISNNGIKINEKENEDFFIASKIAALNNKSIILSPTDKFHSKWTHIGDSTDAALLVMAMKSGINYSHLVNENPRIGLIPLDSNRRMMTSVHNNNGKITAYVKGASTEILSRCTTIYWDKNIVRLTKDIEKKIKERVDDFSADGFRVITLAYRELDKEPKEYESKKIECDLIFFGLAAIYDPPRPEVADAIKVAKAAGIKVIMLTGDHELTAESIAKKTGIITSGACEVLTGSHLEKISDEELKSELKNSEVVFARITPEQKLRIVRALRSMGEIVAVTGDGANDAPALLEADIGIAMGISGSDVARESADMILMDDSFASIVYGIEQGRAVFDNLKKFVTYVFTHNWAELVAFIIFIILRTPLPLAVIQILIIDLLLEILPSISLTLEHPEHGIMKRLPLPKNSSLLDRWVVARSLFVGLITGSLSLIICFFIWSEAGWSLGQPTIQNVYVYMQGTTAVLVGIMMGQIGMLFACRTSHKSSFSVKPFWNKWLIGSIISVIVLLFAIVYLKPFNIIVQTVPLYPLHWMYLFLIIPVILLIEETRKYVLRRMIRKHVVV